MTYIKLFINITKKQVELEKKIRDIFKKPIEDLFDKPDLIRQNFDNFYNYSLDYYNNLLIKGIKPGEEQLNEVIDLIMETDKNNEPEYYKKLFLLEYLGIKIEEE